MEKHILCTNYRRNFPLCPDVAINIKTIYKHLRSTLRNLVLKIKRKKNNEIQQQHE